MPNDPPEWLTRALQTPAEEDHVTVGGCRIHRMMWGQRQQPGVVLVHGGAGHAHWWSFLAPLFPQYRVVALDLSGHGDSGRRAKYSLDDWTEEVLAVAQGAGIEGPPVVVGHSMGGFVATATAHQPAIARIIGLFPRSAFRSMPLSAAYGGTISQVPIAS